MHPKEFFREVSDLLTPLVEGTASAQLASDSPCDGFTVRDLIGHFTLGRFIFGAGMAGDDERQQELVTTMPAQLGDVLGDDHHETYRQATAAIDNAVAGVEDVSENVNLVFGEMPAGYALQMLSADNYVHCWDLARATGQEFEPPAHLTEAAASFFSSFITEDSRASGAFGPEVAVPADATSFDRMLAFCGRTP
ncbi:MAG: TIGR03086 family metal-binding protein [Acidimicrobiales bacterium]|nr:TIGR03086 family metal-binding protein [Acidimicrobiales bacterium]MDG1878617.1 TIGR03086 family metal-binding protein [Acidimicrobiales bacterium]